MSTISKRTFASCSSNDEAFDVTVYVNDVETPSVSADVNRLEKSIAYNYHLRTTAATNRVRVTLEAKGARLQAVFKCREKYRCVVNARAANQPLVFDGFADAHDEARTNAFLIHNIKALRPDQGLRVRQMAYAMSSPTVLQIFVNEAISLDDDDYASPLADDTVEFQKLLLRLTDNSHNNNEAGCELAESRQYLKTTTLWAPVSCKTGRHLITINLIFTNTYI
jgi:hypothetical protein